eukprot:CAMPEP_0172882936 /NCGR_PEP_ID=MMETSP1075-20121228/121444_1 /TAXON_ID=2916 /ORGANISM="Ceratium fusus, Strain PA161109" /LENGTH=38 /DNA_ID= /DNA_START= /DNA_END= /DNA_ORIENTATION=
MHVCCSMGGVHNECELARIVTTSSLQPNAHRRSGGGNG